MEQKASSDGAVTVVHILYGYTYEFYIKADHSGLAGAAHTKGERAEWFMPEAKKYAEMEARKRKLIK